MTREKLTAEGTVWDNEENEWYITVDGVVESEPAKHFGPIEDYDDGHFSCEVTRVKVHTAGGGFYEKELDSFPVETQKRIELLLECEGEPIHTNDCDE